MRGEWLFRIDQSDKLEYCLNKLYEPPLCNHRATDTELIRQYSTSATFPSPRDFAFNTSESSFQNSSSTKYFHPLINFDDNGETVTFPSFITLVPQLVSSNPNGQQKNSLQIVTATQQTIIKPIPSKTYSNITTDLKPDSSTRSSIFIVTGNDSLPELDNYNSRIQTTTFNVQDTSDRVPNIITADGDKEIVQHQGGGVNLPPLQIFTVGTTKRTTRSPVPIKVVTQKAQTKSHKVHSSKDGVVGDRDKSETSGQPGYDDNLNSSGSE